MPPSAEDHIATLSVVSHDPSPDTITSIVKRVKIMTLKLLPVEVSPDSISDPTSRVITPQVINAYIDAAGDFMEALPYCLLRARKEFLWEANHNPADYGENFCRATACEVLARRTLHQAPPDQISTVMSCRFRHREADGDVSGRVSALEMAIDSHCTIFLSSSEAQDVVQDLWSGRTVQVYDDDGVVSFLPYSEVSYDGFWSHFATGRLGVPRYQNIFRIAVWFLFLFSYSLAVREPLDKLNRDGGDLDEWEIVMYFLGLAFSLEELIPIFDGYKFVGTMQICVARMLKESGFFFCLLALLGIGFLQGLYALDAADGQTEHPSEILNVLIQALLQSPDYEMFKPSPLGLTLYYLWNVATAVVLLNVLISLFSSAYEDVVEDAAAEYLTYFAGKVISMIRAPDEFIYPPPFNVIEIFFVAPFEFFVSEATYAKINRRVMQVVFFIPLCMIALYESQLDPAKNRWVKDWFSSPDEGGEEAPHLHDPEVNGADAARGLKISKKAFQELVSVFPDTTHSGEAVIIGEVKELKAEIAELKKMIIELSAKVG
ncbi:hypothetical protein C2E23DRAFT_887118 [Lenzites betulinus]|nr:hypothetical protein C2E23DRAFT_887118 [Lenzites betulinus]